MPVAADGVIIRRVWANGRALGIWRLKNGVPVLLNLWNGRQRLSGGTANLLVCWRQASPPWNGLFVALSCVWAWDAGGCPPTGDGLPVCNTASTLMLL